MGLQEMNTEYTVKIQTEGRTPVMCGIPAAEVGGGLPSPTVTVVHYDRPVDQRYDLTTICATSPTPRTPRGATPATPRSQPHRLSHTHPPSYTNKLKRTKKKKPSCTVTRERRDNGKLTRDTPRDPSGVSRRAVPCLYSRRTHDESILFRILYIDV